MIRSEADYVASISHGQKVGIDGEKATEAATHPMFKPIVDMRAGTRTVVRKQARVEGRS